MKLSDVERETLRAIARERRSSMADVLRAGIAIPAPAPAVPTREWVLAKLRDFADAGSATAAVGLARELRFDQRQEELDRRRDFGLSVVR